MTLAVRDASIPDSPVARWDPRWKLAALLGFIGATVTLRSPLAAAGAGLFAVALLLLSRVSIRVVIGRAGLLLLGVAPLLALLPFTQPDGFSLALALALRVIAVGLFALVLVRTSPLARTAAAAHALRVPGVLVLIAQLAYRYTFVIAAEARRLRIALRARGFRWQTTTHTYRTTGSAVGSLLVRSGDRADRVADAMRCRGFDGTVRLLVPFRTTMWDVFGVIGAAAGSIALVAWDRVWESEWAAMLFLPTP